MSLISVSIVTFNTWGDTGRCLEAVLGSELGSGQELEVLVHDNGHEPPPAGSRPLSDPRVRLSRSDENLGFGRAHNRNLSRAAGSCFLILNPDTRPEPAAIAVLAGALLADPSLGAVAPQLRNEDGSIQPSCRRLPRFRYELYRALGLDRLGFPPFSRYLMNDWDHGDERLVEQPAGAALMLRTEEMRSLGGFAEAFPIYFEDVDLCRRVAGRHGPILFTPRARIVHGGEGTAGRFRKETTFWLEWSRGVYYRVTGAAPVTRLAVRALTLLTALARMVLLFARGLAGPSSPEAGDARAKARGYALVLSTLVLRDEGRWRRTLLHR